MEVKKGYKQTEVGVIPEDWESKPLRGLVSIIHGFGFDGDYFKDTGTYRLTTPGNFHENGGFRDVGEKQKYYDGHVPDGYVLSKDTIIIAMTEQSEGLLGSAAVIPVDGVYLHNQRLGKLESIRRDICDRFLYRVFNSPYYRTKLRETAAGTKVKHTSPTKLLEIPIPLPPTLHEQEAIAGALSDADAWIESLEQLIAKKRQIKQGSMQELLTGKRRLPGFSGKWETKRFGEITSLRNERVNPRRCGPFDFCIELEHIEQATGRLIGNASTTSTSSLKSLFKTRDVLFGKLRAYLRKYWIAHSDGVCSTEIWVLTPRTEQLTPEYLFQIITVDSFIDAASTAYGTHMPRSDWNVVKNYEIKLPYPVEQTAIATVLSDMDTEIELLESKLAKAREVKQGMMQELLTGRIRLIEN